MRRRELYTGEKPFIFINFSYADTLMAERLLTTLDAEGYRYWFNTKVSPNETDMKEVSERLNASSATILILSDGALQDSLVNWVTEQTIKARRTLIIDLQLETGPVSDYVNDLLQKRTDVVIHREWEMPITRSHRVVQLLGGTKGLSAELAERYYSAGLEVLSDPDSTTEQKNEAYRNILYACENEYPQAEYLIGRFHVSNAENGIGTPDEGVALMRKAAEKGNLDAIYCLGCMLAEGEVFEKDPEAAIKFLSIAAVYNVPDAQYRVAEMLEGGVGTAQDRLQATMWYQKALENGDRRAYLKLAYVYKNGELLKKDDKRAFEYFLEAEKDGNVDAGLELAKCYRDGIGTEPDEKKSEMYFMNAADNGVKEAQYCYALCLEKKKNHTEAFKWLMVSSEEGDKNDPIQKDILFEIGNCYSKGVGVDKDKTTAFMYYYKAMELGHEEAKYEVATCYRKGIGVPVNKRAAIYFNPKYAEEKDEE